VRAALAVVLATTASAALLACPLPAASATQSPATVAAAGGSSLQDLQKAAASARTQIHGLEAEMTAISGRYQAARAQLDQLTADLGTTRLQLDDLQQKLDHEKQLASQRLVAMYKMSDYGWADVLANMQSFTDVETQLTFFRSLSEQDARSAQRLTQLTGQTQNLEHTQSGQRQNALVLETEIAAQRALMSDNIAQRQAVLDDLVGKIKTVIARQRAALRAMASADHGAYTPFTWARALLTQLGMPTTTDNLAAITAWEMAEGGHWHNGAHFNPLNTTQPEPGAAAMNSVGVKAYVNWAQGFRATIATLRNGLYGGILAALSRGNDALAVAHAVAASPWGTGDFGHLLGGT